MKTTFRQWLDAIGFKNIAFGEIPEVENRDWKSCPLPRGWKILHSERPDEANAVVDEKGRKRVLIWPEGRYMFRVHAAELLSRYHIDDRHPTGKDCLFGVAVVDSDPSGDVRVVGQYWDGDLDYMRALIALAERNLDRTAPGWREPLTSWGNV